MIIRKIRAAEWGDGWLIQLATYSRCGSLSCQSLRQRCFNETYELPITGTIRARSATVKDGVLIQEDAQYRLPAVQLPAFIQNRDAILDFWHSGIRYRPELLNQDGSIRQSGLRRPQIGDCIALDAE